jgi:hypothetical protein
MHLHYGHQHFFFRAKEDARPQPDFRGRRSSPTPGKSAFFGLPERNSHEKTVDNMTNSSAEE